MYSVKMSYKAVVLVVPTCVLLFVGAWYFYHYVEEAYVQDSGGSNNYARQTPSRSSVKLKMDLVIVPYFVYDASDEVLLKREKEYMTALQRNLNHDSVRRIHVLTTSTEEITKRIQKFELSNQSKLLTFEVKSTKLMRDVFEYISQNLIGIDVMFLNGDIYLGSGFDRIDPVVMRENKIMYALSRQVKQEERCGFETGRCFKWFYTGSHDAFLFHVTEPLPDAALKDLEFFIPAKGMENIIIWTFRTKLNYCVLNPCSILQIFHLHCTNLRSQDYRERPRVDSAESHGLSPVTQQLVCESSQQARSPRIRIRTIYSLHLVCLIIAICGFTLLIGRVTIKIAQ